MICKNRKTNILLQKLPFFRDLRLFFSAKFEKSDFSPIAITNLEFPTRQNVRYFKENFGHVFPDRSEFFSAR